MLKNMTTQRYASLIQIPAARRILLTATLLPNNLIELMPLLIFVMPAMLREMQQELYLPSSKWPIGWFILCYEIDCIINFLLCSQQFSDISESHSFIYIVSWIRNYLLFEKTNN